MARYEDEQIGGKSYDPVRWDFRGDISEARKHMGIARQILGDLKRFMGLSEIQTHTWRKTLRNGVVVVAMSFIAGPGMADIDQISIYAPPSGGDLEVYGFIVHDFNGTLIARSPSGIELGEFAQDGDGNNIDFNTFDPTFAGYPDDGAKYVTLTNSPEYQIVFFGRYTDEISWDNVPRPDNWEVDYPAWPPPHDPPPPERIDQYDDPNDNNTSAIYKRSDGKGLWHTSSYEKTPSGFRVLNPLTEYGVNINPNTNRDIRDTPNFSTRPHIFVIPMAGRQWTFADYIIALNTTYDEFFNPVAISEIGSDGGAWSMFNSTEIIEESMVESFDLSNKVEKGTHKIICRIPAAWGVTEREMDFVIEVFTSQGKIFKRLGGDQSTFLTTEQVAMEITVGKVDSIENAIQLKASPTN